MCLEYFLTLVRIFRNGERPVSFIPANTAGAKRQQIDVLAKRWHKKTGNLSEALTARKHEGLHAGELSSPVLFGYNPRRRTAHTYSIGGVPQDEAYLSALAGLPHGETSQNDAAAAKQIVKRAQQPHGYFPRLYERRFGIPLTKAIQRHNILVDHKKIHK